MLAPIRWNPFNYESIQFPTNHIIIWQSKSIYLFWPYYNSIKWISFNSYLLSIIYMILRCQ